MWIHMCSTPGISRTRVSSHWLNISNLWKLFGILHLGMIPIDSFALIGWIWFKCPNCFHVFGMVPDMCLIKLVEKKAQKTPFGSHICPAIRGDNPNGQKKTSHYIPNSVIAHSILITLVLYRLIPSFFGAIPNISERISGSNPFFRRWLVESSLDMETSPLII